MNHEDRMRLTMAFIYAFVFTGCVTWVIYNARDPEVGDRCQVGRTGPWGHFERGPDGGLICVVRR